MNLQTGELLTLGLRILGPGGGPEISPSCSSVFFMWLRSGFDTKEDSSEDHVLWPVKQLWARSGHQTEFLLAPSLKMMDMPGPLAQRAPVPKDVSNTVAAGY